MNTAPQNSFEQNEMRLVAEATRDAIALHASSNSADTNQQLIKEVSIKMQSLGYSRVFPQQLAATEKRVQERDPGSDFSANEILGEIDLAGIENRKGWAAAGKGITAAELDIGALVRLKDTPLEGRAIEIMAESICDTDYRDAFNRRGAAIEIFQSKLAGSPRRFNTEMALAAIEAQSDIQLMMRTPERLEEDPEHTPAAAPEPALGERLLKGAGDIFNRFTKAVASADLVVASAIPMTAAGALMLTGMGIEAVELQTLFDQGSAAYAKHLAHVAEVNPKDMTDYIVAAFKGELAGAGTNAAKIGEVLTYASPLAAAAAIYASRGYNQLREWLGKQPFDAEAVHEQAMKASAGMSRDPAPGAPS